MMQKYGAVICPTCQSTNCAQGSAKEATDVQALDTCSESEIQKLAENIPATTRVKEQFNCGRCGCTFNATRA